MNDRLALLTLIAASAATLNGCTDVEASSLDSKNLPHATLAAAMLSAGTPAAIADEAPLKEEATATERYGTVAACPEGEYRLPAWLDAELYRTAAQTSNDPTSIATMIDAIVAANAAAQLLPTLEEKQRAHERFAATFGGDTQSFAAANRASGYPVADNGACVGDDGAASHLTDSNSAEFPQTDAGDKGGMGALPLAGGGLALLAAGAAAAGGGGGGGGGGSTPPTTPPPPVSR